MEFENVELITLIHFGELALILACLKLAVAFLLLCCKCTEITETTHSKLLGGSDGQSASMADSTTISICLLSVAKLLPCSWNLVQS